MISAMILRRFLRAAAMAVLVAVSVPALGDDAKPPAPAREPYIAGQLLVATERMRDPRFRQTVIYMVNHNAQGAMGLVVNRRIGSGSLAKLLKAFGKDDDDAEGDIRLHYGGPVESGQGFVLHSTEYAGDGTVVVNEQFALSTEIGVLKDIATGKGPKLSLFALGYAGWAPGQLERELARDDWVTAPVDPDLVFSETPETTWEKAMNTAGVAL
jgi:putative transcriptional regulator